MAITKNAKGNNAVQKQKPILKELTIDKPLVKGAVCKN